MSNIAIAIKTITNIKPSVTKCDNSVITKIVKKWVIRKKILEKQKAKEKKEWMIIIGSPNYILVSKNLALLGYSLTYTGECRNMAIANTYILILCI